MTEEPSNIWTPLYRTDLKALPGAARLYYAASFYPFLVDLVFTSLA